MAPACNWPSSAKTSTADLRKQLHYPDLIYIPACSFSFLSPPRSPRGYINTLCARFRLFPATKWFTFSNLYTHGGPLAKPLGVCRACFVPLSPFLLPKTMGLLGGDDERSQSCSAVSLFPFAFLPIVLLNRARWSVCEATHPHPRVQGPGGREAVNNI